MPNNNRQAEKVNAVEATRPLENWEVDQISKLRINLQEAQTE
jgi:hypothetical protein